MTLGTQVAIAQPNPPEATAEDKVVRALDELLEELELSQEQQLGMALIMLKHAPELAAMYTNQENPKLSEINALLKKY